MPGKTDPEPVLWTLFGAGGMVSAFLVPVHIVVFGLLLPLGMHPHGTMTAEAMDGLVSNWFVKIYLVVLITLPLFTAAHRTRFTLHELKMKGLEPVLGIVMYGSAIVGSLAAIWMILTA